MSLLISEVLIFPSHWLCGPSSLVSLESGLSRGRTSTLCGVSCPCSSPVQEIQPHHVHSSFFSGYSSKLPSLILKTFIGLLQLSTCNLFLPLSPCTGLPSIALSSQILASTYVRTFSFSAPVIWNTTGFSLASPSSICSLFMSSAQFLEDSLQSKVLWWYLL